MGNATDAVRALRESVDAGDVKRFTPDAFAESVLMFANERDAELQRQLFWSILAGAATNTHGRVHGLELAQKAIEGWLEVLLNKKNVQGRIELARLLHASERVALLPRAKIEATPKGPHVRTEYIYVAEDETAAFAIGTLHLLEIVQRGERSLCRCGLESCRRWFLSYRNDGKSTLGMPQHRYCSTEHSKQATRSRKAREARERRARKATKKSTVRKPK
jgi:hypothetical protein